MGHTLAQCVVSLGFSVWLSIPLLAQQSPPPDDPFAKGAWNLEIGAHGALEAWNYNISQESLLAGITAVSYGLRKNLALVISSPFYYIEQRGPDAWMLGTTWGVRWRVVERRRASGFLEFEVGISKADVYAPPGGTRFNYLALGAAGITTPIAPGTHLLASIKWVHVSNNGLAGRSRNPDIEAVGPRVAVLLRF